MTLCFQKGKILNLRDQMLVLRFSLGELEKCLKALLWRFSALANGEEIDISAFWKATKKLSQFHDRNSVLRVAIRELKKTIDAAHAGTVFAGKGTTMHQVARRIEFRLKDIENLVSDDLDFGVTRIVDKLGRTFSKGTIGSTDIDSQRELFSQLKLELEQILGHIHSSFDPLGSAEEDAKLLKFGEQ